MSLSIGEEADEVAVGRPEGAGRLVRAGERLDAESVHPANPELPFSVRTARGKDERPPVGRQGEGGVLGLEVHPRRKLDRGAQKRRPGRAMEEPGRGETGRADDESRGHRDPGARRRTDEVVTGAGIPDCEPPSAIHFSSLPDRAAFCQRSSGSFARQRLTTRSSAGGVIGDTAEIGAGSSFMIDEMSEAWLAPENAFLPVAIS